MLVQWPGKEKQSPVRITFFSRIDQSIFTTWQPGKGEHVFNRTLPSGCFCDKEDDDHEIVILPPEIVNAVADDERLIMMEIR